MDRPDNPLVALAMNTKKIVRELERLNDTLEGEFGKPVDPRNTEEWENEP